MRGLANALSAASLLLSSGLASAAEPVVLQPTSKWILNYADDSCALRRSFGDADREVVLEMRRFQPTDSLYFTIAGKGIRLPDRAPLKLSVDPDPAPRKIDDPTAIRTAGGHEGYTFLASLESEAEPAHPGQRLAALYDPAPRERSITGITVSSGFTKPFRLATGSLHAPMDGMRKCIDELLTHWGIDAEAQKTLSKRATPKNQMHWAEELQSRYPSSMLRKGESGIVRIRLTVDPQGMPSGCRAQIKAPDDTFERTACDITMRSARFEPALDANGQPIASYFVTTIFYKINW